MQIVSFLSPTNLAEEEHRFFDSKTYNPQLRYDWDSQASREFMVSEPYSALCVSLRQKNYSLAIKEAGRLFETNMVLPMVQVAAEYLHTQPARERQPSVQKVINAFEQAFVQLGLTEYGVEISEQRGFNFRPNQSSKRLTMSAHAELGYLTLAGEVKHELVHIIRFVNTVHNNIPFSTTYLPTEEGLATCCQDYTDGGRPQSLFQHAAEYAVTEVMLQGTFREGYEYLRDLGFSEKLAWQRGIRHKFGWQDTAQPGDIMKPSMYFYHAQKIRQLSLSERYRLFVGKVAAVELSNYPEYTGRVTLPMLEDYYQFSE